MKISPLFIEIWSFEALHRLNFNMQPQKRQDDTNDVKVNFLMCGFVGCMKNMLLANLQFIMSSMCAMEFAEKLTLIHFCLEFA